MATDNSDRKQLLKKIVAIVILIIAGIFGINLSDYIPNFGNEAETDLVEITEQTSEAEGTLTITMIDVGQADSFLLVQNDEVALIDCGTRSSGDDVVEYLKNLGIKKIDYIFGTHPHDDHMGGMYDVITNFEIGNIILPKIMKDDEENLVTKNWYANLKQELKSGEKKGKYNCEYSETGKIYKVGEATINTIWQTEDVKGEINNYSAILKVSFGDMDIIMTGDAEKTVEAECLKFGEEIDAEILKVGHHGSHTSTSEEFLDEISPDYALISSGVGNRYEHPNKEPLDRLEVRGIELYRTDENGTVVITITKNNASFSCAPGDYLTGPELEEREKNEH